MQKQSTVPSGNEFLLCERNWIFYLLMLVGGLFGGYTYSIRGGVFCNAQTANLLLISMNLGQGCFSKAAYYLVPFLAYFSGILLSEFLASYVKRFSLLRWDTFLIGFEFLIILILGCLPAAAPDRLFQVTLNFLCAMQFNTFRQAEGVGMATTFCTNHLRQFGSHLMKYLRKRDPRQAVLFRRHGMMLLMFLLGVYLSTRAGALLGTHTLLLAAAVLLYLFLCLAYADRTYERDRLSQVPHGH